MWVLLPFDGEIKMYILVITMEETTWNKFHLQSTENIYMSLYLQGRGILCRPNYRL